MQTLEELQAVLTAKIQKLDEDRKANSEAIAKERAEMLEIAAADRAQRLKEIHAAEEKAKLRKVAEQEAEQERVKQNRDAQSSLEQKQNQADELVRKQREKLEWLENAISEAEFLEEKHKKDIENLRIVPTEDVAPTEINVEYPTAPLNALKPGEAVEGTEGSTPDNPMMSDHLKHILRQAQRSY